MWTRGTWGTERCQVSGSSSTLQFHKDNLRHLSRFPDFFVTKRILSTDIGISSLSHSMVGKKERRDPYRWRRITLGRRNHLLILSTRQPPSSFSFWAAGGVLGSRGFFPSSPGVWAHGPTPGRRRTDNSRNASWNRLQRREKRFHEMRF